MKCLAMRLCEEFQDRGDVAVLLRTLGLHSVNQTEEVLSRYYPLERYPVRSRYVIEDILQESVSAPDPEN